MGWRRKGHQDHCWLVWDWNQRQEKTRWSLSHHLCWRQYWDRSSWDAGQDHWCAQQCHHSQKERNSCRGGTDVLEPGLAFGSVWRRVPGGSKSDGRGPSRTQKETLPDSWCWKEAARIKWMDWVQHKEREARRHVWVRNRGFSGGVQERDHRLNQSCQSTNRGGNRSHQGWVRYWQSHGPEDDQTKVLNMMHLLLKVNKMIEDLPIYYDCIKYCKNWVKTLIIKRLLGPTIS